MPVLPFKKTIKIKAKNWLKRFLPAELAGTVAAVVVSYIVNHQTGNLIAAAYAGSVSETLGILCNHIYPGCITSTKKIKACT